MKKLSLRARLTITVIIIISAIALMLTLVAMYNAGIFYGVVEENVGNYSQTDPALAKGNIDPALADESYAVYGAAEADEETVYETSIEASGELQFFPFSIGMGSSTALSEDASYPAPAITISAIYSSFNYSSIIFMLLIIAAGGIVTYFALGRALRPVRQLSDEISGITENEMNIRVTAFQAGDEINKLADSFNTLMDRLEKAFAEQKSFATSAAHELKTPLAAIKANIDVLEMDALPADKDYAQTVAVVKKQTERMTTLVDDMFAMSSGDYDIDDEVNLGDMTNSILADLSHKTEAKRLEVSTNIRVENTITTNKTMLRRILANVIGNAVRYTEADGKISIKAYEDSGYVIEVADDGPGIPEKDRAHIFQAFYRVDSSRSRKAGGAGLGLAISKNMVEKLEGSITMQPCNPKGSLFIIRLPKL